MSADGHPSPVTPANAEEPCATCGGLGRIVGTAYLADEFGSEVPAEEPCMDCDGCGNTYPAPMPALRNVVPIIDCDETALPF